MVSNTIGETSGRNRLMQLEWSKHKHVLQLISVFTRPSVGSRAVIRSDEDGGPLANRNALLFFKKLAKVLLESLLPRSIVASRFRKQNSLVKWV
ncbi:hypothetical protein CEXT_18941 [Caerostris extrusa]|uniref:Uncharacterized protein n=1 Tax=Caerostris extrusa TaxID=172846 RepID=A0AAV4VEK6_CAEEX|nr:hypothetical protein CEXT_18941 [Caerostris extrusa]